MMLSRCVLLSSCAWLALPLQAAELLLYTEENPPLNYSQAGQPAGFVVEVVRALQARSGDSARIELAPWTRGYNQAKSLANVGCLPPSVVPRVKRCSNGSGRWCSRAPVSTRTKIRPCASTAWPMPLAMAAWRCRGSGTATNT